MTYLVEFSNKIAVKWILHIIDQKVHDGFGHAVLNIFANDKKVCFDEALDDFAFSFFLEKTRQIVYFEIIYWKTE